MNITDVDGLWRLTSGQIENRRTGEMRRLDRSPSPSRITFMPYAKYLRKCEEAFAAGVWPPTYWKSGRVTD